MCRCAGRHLNRGLCRHPAWCLRRHLNRYLRRHMCRHPCWCSGGDPSWGSSWRSGGDPSWGSSRHTGRHSSWRPSGCSSRHTGWHTSWRPGRCSGRHSCWRPRRHTSWRPRRRRPTRAQSIATHLPPRRRPPAQHTHRRTRAIRRGATCRTPVPRRHRPQRHAHVAGIRVRARNRRSAIRTTHRRLHTHTLRHTPRARRTLPRRVVASIGNRRHVQPRAYAAHMQRPPHHRLRRSIARHPRAQRLDATR